MKKLNGHDKWPIWLRIIIAFVLVFILIIIGVFLMIRQLSQIENLPNSYKEKVMEEVVSNYKQIPGVQEKLKRQGIEIPAIGKEERKNQLQEWVQKIEKFYLSMGRYPTREEVEAWEQWNRPDYKTCEIAGKSQAVLYTPLTLFFGPKESPAPFYIYRTETKRYEEKMISYGEHIIDCLTEDNTKAELETMREKIKQFQVSKGRLPSYNEVKKLGSGIDKFSIDTCRSKDGKNQLTLSMTIGGYSDPQYGMNTPSKLILYRTFTDNIEERELSLTPGWFTADCP
ncbi:hypothetical protein A3C23_01280 [Candidatus Roizmanbacteria bacterium RIFCSPHIGHO2_02_FULL_37_13b]|uniref:Uncharacterized protein n=1 Tax=Candidatus Roizmanbacteria bacterium RIFCSPLOWO2_02_FULL_36_11 TaxID=1802071 RepID=A0A1F7JHE3_9BACT|nr:MAG: hypothetical protein A3C23_01280 [Candidatus Roizmanbacteria bacterium RIFCSPHIGHO2_02_FULL_37_13b]OGK55028.1 MAG: hypothetical protein A3H78_00955 [Candidatus Roizmanbacteria bacterium RIFCSPLOWO2_02_FULL_36_11]